MPETTKRRLRNKYYEGGLESMLDAMAMLILCVGLVVAFFIFVALSSKGGFLPAAATAFNSFLGWLLLRSLAEIIRLLKKSAGVPYGGKISEVRENSSYECANCGTLLYHEDKCESCGRSIVGDIGEGESGKAGQ